MSPIVLHIDDDSLTHSVVELALGHNFQFTTAKNGEEGIRAALQHMPDIILLDIDLPGQNGYEVCDALKQNSITKDIPVVFCSSRDELRDRLQGFEMGGADYILKPFDPDELRHKLILLIDNYKRQQALEEEVNEARQTALTAMSSSSEIGQAVQFVEKSYIADNYESLAMSLLEFTNGLGLSCACLVVTDGIEHWFSPNKSTCPLETQVMTLLRNKPRFHDFGCRTQVNYANISLLVKNMPLDDMERYGRIKDLLPLVMGAADARITSMLTEIAVKKQTEDLNKSFVSVQQTFGELSNNLRNNNVESAVVMRSLLNAIAINIPRMGLEEEQENYILNSIEETIKKVIEINDSGDNINSAFDMVLAHLQSLVDQQKQMHETVSHVVEQPVEEFVDDALAVELF